MTRSSKRAGWARKARGDTGGGPITRRLVRAIPCPECQAQPTARCVRAGQLMEKNHSWRQKMAELIGRDRLELIADGTWAFSADQWERVLAMSQPHARRRQPRPKPLSEAEQRREAVTQRIMHPPVDHEQPLAGMTVSELAREEAALDRSIAAIRAELGRRR